MGVKIGRNSACPCGSGKKYKGCCRQSSAGKVDQVGTIANIIKNTRITCLLCNSGKVSYHANFIPNKEFAKVLKVPGNKIRNYIYSLCESCFALPDKSDRVEELILARIDETIGYDLGVKPPTEPDDTPNRP